MKRNQVVLIYGMPASGKYTVAKKVQEKCGGILLDNHYFYDMFIEMTEDVDERWYEYDKSVSRVRKVFLDVLRNFYPKKQHIRYIFTGVYLRDEKDPKILKKFANDIDADFIPIELSVRPDVLLERCDNKVRRKRKKISDKNKYGKLLNQWMPNAFHAKNHNKLVIDSSDLSLDETFEKIKEHLKKFD